MKKLHLFAVERADHLVQPTEFSDTTLNTTALHFVTDFKTNSPAMLDANTCAIEAAEMMHLEHSKLKLVVDQQQEMIGLISQEQLSSQHLMKRLGKGIQRKEVTVSDLMQPRSEIKALSYQQLQHCTIGDVLTTLQSHKEPYCLVVDTTSHHIRGLLCASEISKRLHISLHIEKGPTFLNIFNEVDL